MREKEYIRDYLELERKTLDCLDEEEILQVLNAFLTTYEAGGTIYICGNGGSASTASHLANDFNKGISEFVEKKFRVNCLNDNVATLMSISNDIGYEEVFRFQLKNKLAPQDLVIGISGSGNSGNIVNAIAYAKECGVKTAGFCGYGGGKLKELADVCFHVKLNNKQIVEDMHLNLNHQRMKVINRILGITDAC